MRSKGTAFTNYGLTLCLWILFTPFQYGYHISVLNQLQTVLTCKNKTPSKSQGVLPTCIPMDDFTFSAVTSAFTVGGLVGSLFANVFMDRYGRKGASRVSAGCTTVGAGLMGVSSSVFALGLGRFITGIGSGVGICVAPIFLAEIAPTKISGSVGVLNQLGLVFGIFITQLIGLNFASSWRIVLFISAGIAFTQWLTSGFMVDTPEWTAAHESNQEASSIERRLWGSNPVPQLGPAEPSDTVFDDEADDETTITAAHPLLSAEPDESQTFIANAQGPSANSHPINLATLLLRRPADVRIPMVIVSFAMLGQQLSGINAVLYYSNEILSKALPDMGPYVSLGVTIVNVIMTFPPIFLIEKVGRRGLLTASTLGALASLVVVGFALNNAWTVLASAGIITFVMSFAIGLGPIPFVIIPEVSPFYAVSALSSLALSLNWIVNFFVSLMFLPLRNLLSGGDAGKEGRVFWVFALSLLVVMSVFRATYRG